ncbi:hypothetical protein Droror1_Dr00009584 [Drosera rotundifolia]
MELGSKDSVVCRTLDDECCGKLGEGWWFWRRGLGLRDWCWVAKYVFWRRGDIAEGGDNEIQQTMLEVVNQLDGFDELDVRCRHQDSIVAGFLVMLSDAGVAGFRWRSWSSGLLWLGLVWLMPGSSRNGTISD